MAKKDDAEDKGAEAEENSAEEAEPVEDSGGDAGEDEQYEAGESEVTRDTIKLRAEVASREARHNRLYAPFLLVPALALLPAFIFRLLGRTANTPVRVWAVVATIGVATGISALGRKVPWLSTMPTRQRVTGGIALTISAAAAGLGMLLGFDTVGFAAIGATAVLMLDSPAFETQTWAWLVVGGLFYGTAAAALLSESALTPYLWQAGAAGWLAVLGGITVVSLTAGSKESIRMPLIAAAASTLALGAGEYFDRTAAVGLPSYTYAVGVAVNLVLAGVGYAAAVFDHRSALAWGGMGSVVYAMFGPAGYSVYLLASLATALAELLSGKRKPRPAWGFVRVLFELSPGVFLLLLLFLFHSKEDPQLMFLLMGVAALSAAAAVSAGAAVGGRWSKRAYRILPWKKMKPGTHGAVSYQGTIGVLVTAFLAALAPLLLRIDPAYGYTFGWGILLGAAAFAAVMLRSLLAGFGFLPKGNISRAAGPALAAAAALFLKLLSGT